MGLRADSHTLTPSKMSATRPTLAEVQARMEAIVGRSYTIPIERNKGKVGHTLEELLGIPKSSACLDCADGEVKCFPVKRGRGGELVPKETVAVTMLQPEDLRSCCWEESRCCKKMARVLMAPYLREGDRITFLRPKLLDFGTADCTAAAAKLKTDYEKLQREGAGAGNMHTVSGAYLQQRTKGPGRGAPKTMAYYLKKEFMKELVPMTAVAESAPPS
jgi:DNA mismatch repair protein MutH